MFGADQGGVERRQPDRRLPGVPAERGTKGVAGSNAASAAADSLQPPISPVPPCWPPALDGPSEGTRLGSSSRNCAGDSVMAPKGAREIPKTLREAAELAAAFGIPADPLFGAEVVEHYAHAARWGDFRTRPRGLPTGKSRRGLERA